MKNNPTRHSAGLELSEDSVNRAIALRGGKNLDDAFLMDLLDAGLAIMELSAGSHDERAAIQTVRAAASRPRNLHRPSWRNSLMFMRSSTARWNEQSGGRT